MSVLCQCPLHPAVCSAGITKHDQQGRCVCLGEKKGKSEFLQVSVDVLLVRAEFLWPLQLCRAWGRVEFELKFGTRIRSSRVIPEGGD